MDKTYIKQYSIVLTEVRSFSKKKFFFKSTNFHCNENIDLKSYGADKISGQSFN